MTHTNREKIEGVREGEVEKFLLGKMPAFHKGKLDPDTMKFVIQIASKTLPSYIQEEVDKARNDLIDELLGGVAQESEARHLRVSKHGRWVCRTTHRLQAGV